MNIPSLFEVNAGTLCLQKFTTLPPVFFYRGWRDLSCKTEKIKKNIVTISAGQQWKNFFVSITVILLIKLNFQQEYNGKTATAER